MSSKRIIVLANSIKKGARCVAGREVGTGSERVLAGWIRPVSDESEGELQPRHMRMEGGGGPAVLQIVDVPLLRYPADPIHPEDWIIDVARKWTRIGVLDAHAAQSLEERPEDLWLESVAHPDRVTPAALRGQMGHQSLYLIRPTEFRVELSIEHNAYKNKDQKKSRARFTFGGREYHMSITDPVFTDRYCRAYPALGSPPTTVRPRSAGCLLCVSLTPEFKGYHYKVVATVLESP